MDDRFLSAIRKYEEMTVGSAQARFLYMIAESPLATYEIHARIKKEIDIKNVRKTVNRLHELGLIEIEGYYPRGKIKYRLTSHGLFQLLFDSIVPKSIVGLYKDDIVLKTILYEFFSIDTITEWLELEAPFLLSEYIGKCCRACLEESQSMGRKYRISRRNEMSYLPGLLQTAISREIYQFITTILVNTVHQREDHPEIKRIPELALGRDEKFIALAKRIKKTFQEGCDVYMI